MSHRAHFALIADNQVQFCSDKWGALGLAEILALGPTRFRTWFERELEVNPDAALGVIPDAFVVVHADFRQIKLSEEPGLQHQAENAMAQFPNVPELADQLSHATSQALHAFLMVLHEIWEGWEVVLASPPQPQFDWEHLRGVSADEVWKAFEVLPSLSAQGEGLLPSLRALLAHQTELIWL
ncbi:hypothetical protein [Deinococcus hopiensis]|uniref:Uncharacterized protein n=1 Tax=Deinococcus hopiensis KR-140 TaxID=695939 RepID=A0A1W1UZM0_9DEIO|nr:hypothetical protein [Deinococcus hopiensis]SMB86558.1 hypothetical protein SAMN00790413_03845 [Deinococcus hopiensis KR-140]